MTLQSKKQIQNQSQSGRSMVEMLGVLAIIAILSIGGIIGFRLAMNYYQANQIAHEMNIMRTDAQIKIAQGTEKLMLGEPYDPISESMLGHIQFNDDYPVDFACALADEDTIELSNISCHVANAYYIELQNIPEGVCRPLAELVNGMNNIIAFNVNKNEYPGEGTCEAGNENVLNAVFSAEAVSELKVCAEDTDCESESAPYCDLSRHVCVRCYEDSQCAHNQYCENNTCVACENGVWNGEECVECTDNDDCTDSDTPVCYTDTNTCVECLTYENCIDKTGTPQCDKASHTCKSCIDIDSEKPVWADTQCVECAESTDCETTLVCRENTCSLCETEDECKEKGTNYHCSKDSTCIQCLDNQVWDDESKECVECTEDNDCTDTPDTPKCNTTTNQCVECLTAGDCNNPTPICSEENTCVACKTNDECRLKNPSEENCTENGACCADPLMTWNGSECVCPEDYAKSETSSGKAVCLPYCEQEVGLIIMTDRSGSMGNTKTDDYNNVMQQIKEAQQKLHIPEDIYSAVYFTGCSGTPSGDPCPYRAKMDVLPYGKHSAAEIQSKMDPTWTYQTAYSTFFAAFNEDITPMCQKKGRKLKLIIILFWDVDGSDVRKLNALSQYCDTVIYNVSVNGSAVSTNNGTYTLNARQTFKLSEFKESDIDLINDGIHQEGCVEKTN